MASMFVTLDVSKLSGWLNAVAYCRVERRACDAGRGAAREARGRGAAAAHRRRKRCVHGEGPTRGCIGSRAREGAYLEQSGHGCGRVWGVRRQASCTGKVRLKAGGTGHTRSAPRTYHGILTMREEYPILPWHTSMAWDTNMGTHAERTWNICCMFVTLEVSQLDMSASKFLKA